MATRISSMGTYGMDTVPPSGGVLQVYHTTDTIQPSQIQLSSDPPNYSVRSNTIFPQHHIDVKNHLSHAHTPERTPGYSPQQGDCRPCLHFPAEKNGDDLWITFSPTSTTSGGQTISYQSTTTSSDSWDCRRQHDSSSFRVMTAENRVGESFDTFLRQANKIPAKGLYGLPNQQQSGVFTEVHNHQVVSSSAGIVSSVIDRSECMSDRPLEPTAENCQQVEGQHLSHEMMMAIGDSSTTVQTLSEVDGRRRKSTRPFSEILPEKQNHQMVGWPAQCPGTYSSVCDDGAMTHKDTSKKACPEVDDLISRFGEMNFDIDKWTSAAMMVQQSFDPEQRREGAKYFRMMLSVSGEIPIQAVIETGVLPKLASYISPEYEEDLRFDAAWALTNIASGTPLQTEAVVASGVIYRFAYLLTSQNEELREQGMWGIGNVAGDRVTFRDEVLAVENIVSLFVDAIQVSKRMQTVRIAVWAISNLCRGRPRPEVTKILHFVDMLVILLRVTTDVEVLADACWALDGIAESPLGVSCLVKHGIIGRLVDLLAHSDPMVLRPALRIIGQVATGSVSQTQTIIDASGIDRLCDVMVSTRRSIRKDACWALSNICVGTESQLQAVIDSRAIPTMIDLFDTDPEIEVSREAAWGICNSAMMASKDQVYRLLRMNVMHSLCRLLDIASPKILDTALDAISNVLKVGSFIDKSTGVIVNILAAAISEADGLNKLRLIQHTTQDFGIHEKIEKILEAYPNVDYCVH